MTTPAGGSSASFGYGMLVAQGVSSLITAFGGLSATKNRNAAAESRANIARINAQMMMRQYEATLRASEKSVVSKTMAAGQAKASQRAALAANGIAVGEGSAAELQASTDIVKEMDVNQIRSNALSEAWGYRNKATNYLGESYAAEAQKTSRGLQFGVSLLNGASQVANNYMLISASGMFNQGTSAGAGSAKVGTTAYGQQSWQGSKTWSVGSDGKWW